jgi:hypothetical protein
MVIKTDGYEIGLNVSQKANGEITATIGDIQNSINSLGKAVDKFIAKQEQPPNDDEDEGFIE